jgi:O-antigen ligase
VTSAQTTATNQISSIILFAVVAAAPFPFGSVEPTAIAFWCIVLGLGVATASPRKLRREHFPLVVLAAILILGYAFVLHEQLAVRPFIAEPHPVWNETAKILGEPVAASASIARNQPFFALGAPLANMLAIICSFIVCIDRRRAHQLILVIAWSGAGYAFYGIAMYLLDPTHVLWREKLIYQGVLTATFISRNAAAVYFGSCAVLWLLLLCQQIRQKLPPGPIYWRLVPRMFTSEFSRPVILPFSMVILCVAAMLLTNSRAGVVISLAISVVAFGLYFRRDLPGRGAVLATFAVGGLVALAILQVLGANVSGRFDLQGLSDEGRVETYRSTFRIIADHPWFGTGLGTFPWSFPAYRSDTLSAWGTWDRAHSTPLELASDLGLPLTVLIVVAWVVILGMLVRGIIIRRRDIIVPIAAFSVASLGVLHSSIDFSLQIPGYSIVVFALLGAGLAQSYTSSYTKESFSNSSANRD